MRKDQLQICVVVHLTVMAIGALIVAFTFSSGVSKNLLMLSISVITSYSISYFRSQDVLPKSAIPRPGWPRLWELLGYAIPHKTRNTVYEPGRNDLLEDYLFTRRKYRTKWSRAWLQFCNVLWTLFLLVDCWRVLFGSMSLRIFLKCIPAPMRRWWTLGVSGENTSLTDPYDRD